MKTVVCDEAPTELNARTRKLAMGIKAVGVPLIKPVALFRFSPVGSGGEMVKRVITPPELSMVTELLTALFNVATSEGVA